jgi:hypothetical protein
MRQLRPSLRIQSALIATGSSAEPVERAPCEAGRFDRAVGRKYCPADVAAESDDAGIEDEGLRRPGNGLRQKRDLSNAARSNSNVDDDPKNSARPGLNLRAQPHRNGGGLPRLSCVIQPRLPVGSFADEDNTGTRHY